MRKGSALEQNNPNPFKPGTAIFYSRPESCHLRLVIYDTLGQEVKAPVDEVQDVGGKKVSSYGGELREGFALR